ncbi:hypothetical protein N0V85_006457 [Neurospora sp. IMI 360204]|nr:hypothetical protein N0V85_006457 [Neurospora sp. IMI 360204]
MSLQQDFVTVQITVRIPRTLLNNTNSHHFVIEVGPGQEHHTEASITANDTNMVDNTITHIPHAISGQEKTSTTTAEEGTNKVADSAVPAHNPVKEEKSNLTKSKATITKAAMTKVTSSTEIAKKKLKHILSSRALQIIKETMILEAQKKEAQEDEAQEGEKDKKITSDHEALVTFIN